MKAFLLKLLAILCGIPVVLVMLVVLVISNIVELLRGDHEDDPDERQL